MSATAVYSPALMPWTIRSRVCWTCSWVRWWAVRPCGVVSVPGVYGGPVTVDMGSIVQKGLRLCSGQTHVKRYLEPLTKLIQEKKVDTTFMISHRSTDLADGPDLYQTFKAKKDGCVKVVFHPA